MAGRILVGMSGFSYPEWIGGLYPKGTKRQDMLAAYATRFDAVEINMTFRRMPREDLLARWRDAVGEDFRFALKAHQRITHTKRLRDVESDVADFVRAARVLGDRLGVVLFQVPPSMSFDADHLEGFLSTLPPVVPYAFEPRHPSFANGEADRRLAAHRVARCLNDDLDDPAAHEATGPVAYLRLRREAYERKDLEACASLARRFADEDVDAYVFFKHEDRPDAVEPALALRELVG